MTGDMQMLIATAILAFLHSFIVLIPYIKHWGLPVAVGNRENTPALPPWAGRALRAHRNMTENFVHFAVFVLAANYLGLSSQLTIVGATLFFWCRLGYLVVYIAGLAWIRTALFVGAVTGEAMIIYQLVTNIA